MASVRCRLLELPAELRTRIYEYALAPTGTVCLMTTRYKRRATLPVLGPALLSTCRQVYSEAVEILYTENTICISVDAHDTCWPTISESRLPQRVLERLQRMCIILDCTANFSAAYCDVDWTAFSALTALKMLKIAVVIRTGNLNYAPRFREEYGQALLTQVLERIPATCSVAYGTEKNSGEREFLEQIAERCQRSFGTTDSPGTLQARAYGLGLGSGPDVVHEGDATGMATIAASIEEVEQGCKSGGIANVFAEYH